MKISVVTNKYNDHYNLQKLHTIYVLTKISWKFCKFIIQNKTFE